MGMQDNVQAFLDYNFANFICLYLSYFFNDISFDVYFSLTVVFSISRLKIRLQRYLNAVYKKKIFLYYKYVQV